MKIKLSKIEVAGIQLNEAIYLFFDKAHPLIIETLIGATTELLRGIGKSKGITAILHDSDFIKPEYKKKWIFNIRKAQNFFKHADRDSEDILDYETTTLPFRIYEACHIYRLLSSTLHLSMSVRMFEIWFCCRYPNLLINKEEYLESLCLSKIPEDFLYNFENLKLLAQEHRITTTYEDIIKNDEKKFSPLIKLINNLT